MIEMTFLLEREDYEKIKFKLIIYLVLFIFFYCSQAHINPNHLKFKKK